MKLAIGADHAGYALKDQIRDYLTEKGHELVDFGTHGSESVDYPDFGHAVGEYVAAGKAELGIVICGSGIGISISANKVEGIRCACVSESYSAAMARRHNNANVIAFGARVVGLDVAKLIVDAFLENSFEGGRHARRVEKIEAVHLTNA